MLQFADNSTDAIEILKSAYRTCSIHLGLGSAKDNNFKLILYSYKNLTVYDDKNYTYANYHPQMDGVAYWDKHVQPSKN